MKIMKIVVFGVGDYFNSRKEKLKGCGDIIGYTDNNKTLWGKSIDGIRIVRPEEIMDLHFDIVVIMSIFAHSIKQQLLELGVREESVRFFTEYYGEVKKNELKIYFQPDFPINAGKRKILIISNFIRYSSAYTIVVNTILALRLQGYQVAVASVDGDEGAIDGIRKKGIVVITYGNLHHAAKEELFWIREYDCVIVNTSYYLGSIIEISKIRPVIWWIHEPPKYIKASFDYLNKYRREDFEEISVYAVCHPAKRGMEECLPEKDIGILTYGIEEEAEKRGNRRKNGKVVFAVIGYVSPIKAQDLFIEAVANLGEEEKQKAEFWLIGSINEIGFGHTVREMAEKEKGIRIFGEVSREEMGNLYNEIDVVVNPSRTDLLPMVIAEGMQHAKVCITSDATGMAAYIRNGENGFVFRTEDYQALAACMRRMIDHPEEALRIGKKGKETYDQFFSITSFAAHLDEIIRKAKERYASRQG